MGTGGVFKRLGRVTALAICGVLALGGSAAGIDLFPPSPELTFTASFAPKQLPPDRPAPIAPRFTAKVRMSDGSFPTPVEELDLRLDRHLKVEADDLPPNAIVASGKMKWLVELPEQEPLPITGGVTIRYKASKGSRTSLTGVVRVNRPKPAKLQFPVEVTPNRNGRYGWKAVLPVPRAGGGAGSLTYLGLGFRKGLFSAACADGRLQVQARTRFTDGTLISAAVFRTCEAQGRR